MAAMLELNNLHKDLADKGFNQVRIYMSVPNSNYENILSRLHNYITIITISVHLAYQIYVNQMTDEIMAVTRHSHSTHKSVILVVHTAFRCPDDSVIPTNKNPNKHYSHVPPLTIPGEVEEIILEARLVKRVGETEFQPASDVINGLESHSVDMRKHISPSQSKMCHLFKHKGGSTQEVVFSDFCPGSIVIFK